MEVGLLAVEGQLCWRPVGGDPDDCGRPHVVVRHSLYTGLHLGLRAGGIREKTRAIQSANQGDRRRHWEPRMHPAEGHERAIQAVAAHQARHFLSLESPDGNVQAEVMASSGCAALERQ